MKSFIRKPFILFVPIIISASILSSGCARKMELKKTDAARRAYPLKVAVLPFSAENEEMREGADLIRKLFTANLKESNLDIMELSVVDSLLKRNNITSQSQIDALMSSNPRRFGEIFSSNTVIWGKVNKWNRVYAVVESSVEVEATIKMADTFSGNTIIEVSKGEKKSSGLTRIPTGYVQAAVTPITGMQKSYLYQLSNELSRNLAQPFIDTFQTDTIAPLIITACAVIKKKESGQDSLYLVLIGDSEKRAYFSIGNLVKIPMTETSRGCYCGYYEGSFGNLDKVNFTLVKNNVEENYSVKIGVSD